MCGRYTLSTPGDELADVFGLEEALELEPRFNIAPTQMAPVARSGRQGAREASMLRWGLIPHWAKDVSIGSRMINARSETVADKPAYRDPFRERRCLVMADGFYEWRAVGRHKQPFYFGLHDGSPMAFAGVWDRWRGEGEPIETFALLTTDANADVAPVHDRMPVILAPASWPRWLDTGAEGADSLLPLLEPAPQGLLGSHPVSTWVNSPANDTSRCIEAIPIGLEGAAQGSLFD